MKVTLKILQKRLDTSHCLKVVKLVLPKVAKTIIVLLYLTFLGWYHAKEYQESLTCFPVALLICHLPYPLTWTIEHIVQNRSIEVASQRFGLYLELMSAFAPYQARPTRPLNISFHINISVSGEAGLSLSLSLSLLLSSVLD